ncbi:2-oxo acid dehydrogenase subunit E2 [Brevibacillus dissolubilis]|uniref:2-oxo acid dehydrogenase subunit E2 n=1 Tax=Brevibacillus dissolubilis TaxID=1844116 RepID=UPI001116930D|nr:2-oxo acid dehydrogenase subunit E2 [Brevibacillus dissolubilis]
MAGLRTVLFPKERRHTYYFLEHAQEFRPVYLDVDVDMTNVKLARQAYKSKGDTISYVTFLIHAISQVLRKYPEANSTIKHGFRPKMAYYSDITAKFTIDKVINDKRVVLSGLVSHSDRIGLKEIQQTVEHFRDHSFEELEEFAAVRKLQSLPLGIGQWVYNRVLNNLAKREELQGTFCITSLGHQPIQSFYPIISATVCFGVGTIEDKPVVRNGEIIVRPMMRLSLAFDHRAIDGGMAADILADVKTYVENFAEER